jgi:hypothetical protein
MLRKSMIALAALASVGTMTLSPITASAFGTVAAEDRAECTKAAGDEAIAACTRLITAGGLGAFAPFALYNRGIAYSQKAELSAALADFSEAINSIRSSLLRTPAAELRIGSRARSNRHSRTGTRRSGSIRSTRFRISTRYPT